MDGEAAHAARCTNDQDSVSRLHLSFADGLQRGTCRDRDGCGLLERQVRWLTRDHARSGRDVLGERPVAGAVDLVAPLEAGDVLADGLDGSGEAAAGIERLWPTKAEAGETHRVGEPRHAVPGPHVDAGGGNPHQRLIVSERRLCNVGHSEDCFGFGSVRDLDDRLHRFDFAVTSSRYRFTDCCVRECEGA